jgi:succinate-semialdehyde dehydrogenase / glutarate-semialdehyde dehydrogenase
MAIESINPATGEIIEVFEEWTAEQTRAVVDETHEAWLSWRATTFPERRSLMREAADLLRRRRDAYARVMAQEMGKPVTDGRAEVEKCALGCEFFADNAERFLSDEPGEGGGRSFITFDPLGVILGVMPWNFPFWQVFRFAAPVLMAGNAGILKHSSNVPRCALAIEHLFQEAGFPPVFRTLLIGSKQVEEVIAHAKVRGVSLTGSEPAGRQVAAKAGERLKKTVLELGGSDPFVVLADADLERAATAGAQARCLNSGQSCIAAKRFIVVDAIYNEFMEKFTAAMAGLRVGDPLLDDTAIGPLARRDLLLDLHRQVQDSVALGAKVVLGGEPVGGRGYFFPPTVLADVAPGMPAYDEELFGPAASVIRVADEDEAVRVANDTSFGLGGSVWTRNLSRGETLARRIEAGTVTVNMMVRSDPRLPFGGVRNSGYGRELSHYGIKEFVNIKTVKVG